MEMILNSKERVTLPKAIRDALHLRPGDQLELILEPDGSVRMLPIIGSVQRLKGMLLQPINPLTLAEMDAAIAQGAADS
jgi:AbrB family looped-hinge helix DNA binding protein